MSRRPEDYPADSRIYTGLYSAKAYNALKAALPSVSDDWNSPVPVRSNTGETVIVTSDRYWVNAPAGYRTCRDWMLAKTAEYLTSHGCPVPDDCRKTLVHFLKHGEKGLDEKGLAALAVLRGTPRDDIRTELANCADEEARRIEKEHAAFRSAVESRCGFESATGMFGTYGCRPSRRTERPELERPPFIPEEEVAAFRAAEKRIYEVNNRLAAAVDEYDEAQTAYKEAVSRLKKLSTRIKNDRVKAVRKEFRLVGKRDGSGAAV